jgi:hypothetical protein
VAGLSEPVLASEIRPGHYLCLKTRSPFGALIRLFTRSPWDHAVLVTSPGEIVQATLRGVKHGPLAQFAGCQAVASTGEHLAPWTRDEITAAGVARVGEEYAYTLIGVIALRKLGLRQGWLLRASDDKDAVICSELVALAGQAARLDWLCGEPSPATVRPDELAGREPFMHPVAWDCTAS